MSAKKDDTGGLPTAKQAQQQLALAHAERAAAEAKKRERADAEKQKLIDRLSKPSGVSDEEALKRVTAIIKRALNNGASKVEVYRFPNSLCTDRGRAINQQESGWEDTLTGVPAEVYSFWKRQLRDRGYGLSCEIVDYSGGMPGDVGMTLKWG